VPEYDNSLYVNKKAKCDEASSLELLRAVLPILEAQEDFSNDALFAALSAYAEEKAVKINHVMWPLRTAVSGLAVTPGGATELMSLLGKDETLARIKAAVEKLS
jgi:glutamyl-tRNA synthetase